MGYFYKNQKNPSKSAGVLGANEAQIKTSKEHGRSMVEMLGVLAIVGVLSIGAISGYRYAMNKYRANQVTNELNLLSHQVAVAMMSKNGISGTLTLGDPYDANNKLQSSGYDIAFGCGDNGDDTECSGQNAFHFEVNGVAEGVCKELLTSGQHLQYIDSVNVNEGAGCQSGNENSVNFMFASSDFMSEERISPEDEAYCSGHGKYDATSNYCVCSEGYVGLNCQVDSNCSGRGHWTAIESYYEDGYCECNDGYTGASCQVQVCNGHGTAAWTGKCTCTVGFSGPNCECGEGEQWDGLQCVTSCPEGGCAAQECVQNEDCGSGQYCYYINGWSCTEEFGTGASAQKGQCRSVEADSYTFGKYIASKVGMNWWSANRFCDAQSPRKSLITLDDLSCKPAISGGGYCHKDGAEGSTSTQLAKDLSDWPTELWTIRNAVYITNRLDHIWTATEYNSCSAACVNLNYGNVFGNGRYSYLIAVCK